VRSSDCDCFEGDRLRWRRHIRSTRRSILRNPYYSQFGVWEQVLLSLKRGAIIAQAPARSLVRNEQRSRGVSKIHQSPNRHRKSAIIMHTGDLGDHDFSLFLRTLTCKLTRQSSCPTVVQNPHARKHVLLRTSPENFTCKIHTWFVLNNKGG
jgi:hypothetical protein